METPDQYLTLEAPGPEVLFKDRNSKFFGYAFPVKDEEEIRLFLEEVRQAHRTARHWCYAWQLGETPSAFTYRANDDGEPSNSAGMPIYGQIQSFGLTRVLVVVVRYFGGTKLGVPGLINAYRTTAQMALEACNIIERTIDSHFELHFAYKDMNTVMRIIREKQLQILEQQMELDCRMVLGIRLSEAAGILRAFEPHYEIRIKQLNP